MTYFYHYNRHATKTIHDEQDDVPNDDGIRLQWPYGLDDDGRLLRIRNWTEIQLIFTELTVVKCDGNDIFVLLLLLHCWILKEEVYYIIIGIIVKNQTLSNYLFLFNKTNMLWTYFMSFGECTIFIVDSHDGLYGYRW